MILHGDALNMLKTLPDESVQCCVTSPPYFGLRDYSVQGQIGLEDSPNAYVAKLVAVFREVRRVLRSDGVLWLNLGDSYAGSGRGRDADGTWNPGKGGSKQETNHGAITGRVVNPKSFSKGAIDAGAIGNAWVKPPQGFKAKDLMGIPWMVAFALRTDGWWLRQDIIWSKPNPMPESVTDRCTKSHEYIFLLSKSATYFYDNEAVKEPYTAEIDRWGGDFKRRAINEKIDPDGMANANSLARCGRDMRLDKNGRNRRSVWNITTKPFSGAHFATFPPEIPEICIKAGSKKGDTILDPFAGSGTTLEVAARLDRNYIGIELNEKYIKDLIEPRLANVNPLFQVNPCE
jgi:DNA modification methylase